jgi:nitroreductase
MKIEDFSLLVKERASHRKFLTDPVPEKDIKVMVQNAGMAPNGHNFQPWKFIAVRNKEMIEKAADLVEQGLQQFYPKLDEKTVAKLEKYQFFLSHFKSAPLVIAVLVRKDEYVTSKLQKNEELNFAKPEHFDMELLGIGAAVQNLILSAQAMGYGTCWMTEPVVYAQKAIEKELDVPEDYHFVSQVVVGRPVKKREAMPKKAVEEILTIKS